MDILLKIYAFIATVPFILFFIIYYVAYLCKKTKKESFNIASYVSSILLISAVTGQMNILFDIKHNYLFTILIVVFILIVLVFLQKNIKGRIDVIKLITSTLKLTFLLLSIIYIIFLIIILIRG